MRNINDRSVILILSIAPAIGPTTDGCNSLETTRPEGGRKELVGQLDRNGHAHSIGLTGCRGGQHCIHSRID